MSGVYRKRQRQGSGSGSRVVLLSGLSLGGGDPDLRAAAEIIASGARALAGSWSQQIPPSIAVGVGDHIATISSNVGPARPAELRLNHPLFGNRNFWYGPPGEPFLGPAADARSDAAMVRYAEKIDRWAAKAGFK